MFKSDEWAGSVCISFQRTDKKDRKTYNELNSPNSHRDFVGDVYGVRAPYILLFCGEAW